MLRDHLPFGEVPIKFYMQKRDSHTGSGPGPVLEEDEGEIELIDSYDDEEYDELARDDVARDEVERDET